jgi:hypothetical protein
MADEFSLFPIAVRDWANAVLNQLEMWLTDRG